VTRHGVRVKGIPRSLGIEVGRMSCVMTSGESIDGRGGCADGRKGELQLDSRMVELLALRGAVV